jgi:hypothetical protein
MDALSDILTGLRLECGGRTQNKSSKVKKTIEKASAVSATTSGSPPDVKAKQVSFSRRNPHKNSRVVVCTWGARCKRATCTFFHASPAASFVLPDCHLLSKPCKFGARCHKATCAFWHPSPVALP